MRISETGIELIKTSEMLKLKPYLCPAGVPSIGYGSTYYEDGTPVTLKDSPIDEKKANELLKHGVNCEAETPMSQLVKVPLSQNQYDALCSFAYNVGRGNFKKSTLLKKLNMGDYIGAANELPRWIYSNGKPLRGLKKRRKAEMRLFLK